MIYSSSVDPIAPEAPLRLLLAPSAYYPNIGGIEELTRQLADHLRTRGHHVSVLTNRWPSELSRAETLGGTAVERLEFPLPSASTLGLGRFLTLAPRCATDTVRTIRRLEPDVIHVIGAGPPSVFIASLAPFLPGRIVFTAQGELEFDSHGDFERSATLRFGLRLILGRAHVVTACSAYVLRRLAKVGRIRSRAVVVPNGVDPDEFAACDPETTFGDYVLGVGRLVPQKGFDVLLKAFASVPGDRVQLVLAGDGFERQRLERQAARLQLETRTHFLGSVGRNRLGQLLRGATVFALASRAEPFGIALLEAMAAGVPTVATAAGGIPEFAEDGKNTILVQPDRADQLASALGQLLRDEDLRLKIASGGLETSRRLNWTTLTHSYEEVYASALG
jgi:glycosyltransferase involved in cell wall biosynthesis